jgi:hypothetical protein
LKPISQLMITWAMTMNQTMLMMKSRIWTREPIGSPETFEGRVGGYLIGARSHRKALRRHAAPAPDRRRRSASLGKTLAPAPARTLTSMRTRLTGEK